MFTCCFILSRFYVFLFSFRLSTFFKIDEKIPSQASLIGKLVNEDSLDDSKNRE